MYYNLQQKSRPLSTRSSKENNSNVSQGSLPMIGMGILAFFFSFWVSLSGAVRRMKIPPLQTIPMEFSNTPFYMPAKRDPSDTPNERERLIETGNICICTIVGSVTSLVFFAGIPKLISGKNKSVDFFPRNYNKGNIRTGKKKKWIKAIWA